MRIRFGRLVIFVILVFFGLWLRSLEQRMDASLEIHRLEVDTLERQDKRLGILQRYILTHHQQFKPLWEQEEEE